MTVLRRNGRHARRRTRVGADCGAIRETPALGVPIPLTAPRGSRIRFGPRAGTAQPSSKSPFSALFYVAASVLGRPRCPKAGHDAKPRRAAVALQAPMDKRLGQWCDASPIHRYSGVRRPLSSILRQVATSLQSVAKSIAARDWEAAEKKLRVLRRRHPGRAAVSCNLAHRTVRVAGAATWRRWRSWRRPRDAFRTMRSRRSTWPIRCSCLVASGRLASGSSTHVVPVDRGPGCPRAARHSVVASRRYGTGEAASWPPSIGSRRATTTR